MSWKRSLKGQSDEFIGCFSPSWEPLVPTQHWCGQTLPVWVTVLKFGPSYFPVTTCWIFEDSFILDLSIALVPPFPFSCFDADIMQVLWLLAVYLHLLVCWVFVAILFFSFVVYAACEFLVLRFSCSVFKLEIEDIKNLCRHSHHLSWILYSHKIPVF